MKVQLDLIIGQSLDGEGMSLIVRCVLNKGYRLGSFPTQWAAKF